VERLRLTQKATGAILKVEIDREDDGRWLAEIVELPGVMAYGETKAEVIRRVYALALRVLADKVEHNEDVPSELLPLSLVHS
jgi:predicted RNase H-like HicB family nuclease